MSDQMKWHPAASIFPMMLDDELQELAEDIRKNGQREPISIYQGMILDGRNRSAACMIANAEPITIKVDPEDPVAYVLSLNLHRRHLSPSQQAMVGNDVRSYYDEEAKERQKRKSNSVPVNLPEQKKGDSRDKAAAAVGVSGSSIDHARTVSTSGVPELAEAVRSGGISVSSAAAVATLPEAEQKQIVEAGKVREKASEMRAAKKASREESQKSAAGKPRHDGEHNKSKVFAITKADVAITQLKGIPAGNDYRDAALDRVVKWINSQRKAN